MLPVSIRDTILIEARAGKAVAVGYARMIALSANITMALQTCNKNEKKCLNSYEFISTTSKQLNENWPLNYSKIESIAARAENDSFEDFFQITKVIFQELRRIYKIFIVD